MKTICNFKNILFIVLSFFALTSCGKTAATATTTSSTSSSTGFPSASVQCGSEACVK